MNIRASKDAAGQVSEAYDEYKDAIFRHCYFHLFDRELAKDLLQETFAKTWVYISEGHDIDNIRAFLYKVATNLIRNHVRKKKEQSLEAMQEEHGFDPATDDNPNDRDFVEEESAVRLLAHVKEPYRTAVAMRYIEGFSPAEIAEITGKSTNVVSVHIHRGLKQLRSKLDRDG